MSNGKDIVMKYCNQFSVASMEHIQQCIDNKRNIEQGNYRKLEGCPSSFGLDDYEGLCETEQVEGLENQIEQCEQCWKSALGVK